MIKARVSVNPAAGNGSVEIGTTKWVATGPVERLRVELVGVLVDEAARRGEPLLAEISEEGDRDGRWLLVQPTGEVAPASRPTTATDGSVGDSVESPEYDEQTGSTDADDLSATERPASPPTRVAPKPLAGGVVEPIPQPAPAPPAEDYLGGLDLVSAATATVRGAARQLPRCVVVLVANNKGESGKTPVAVLIAQAFATTRGGDVAIVDLDPTGNLSARVGVDPAQGRLPDVVAAIDAEPAMSWASVLNQLAWEPTARLWVVTSRGVAKSKSPVASAITAAQFLRLVAALQTGIRVLVVDAGNNDQDEVFLAAASIADQLVVPVKWDVPTVSVGARGVLATLYEVGMTDLALGAIAVGTYPPNRQPNRRQARRLRAEFDRLGHAIVDIPVDRHIDARTAISWQALKPTTRTAAMTLANMIGDRVAARMRPR